MADALQKAEAQKFVAEYAKSGRSSCKASKDKIEQGALRIGKVISGEDNPFCAGKEMTVWYIPEALFDSFRKGREGKSHLDSTDTLEGYDNLKEEDQKRMAKMIEEENEFRDGLSAVDDEATYLENTEDENNKFWQISVNENSTRVKYGEIGADGFVSEKQHKDNAAAEKFVEKMVKQKKGKGYVDATKGGAGSKRKSAAVAEPKGKKAAKGKKQKVEPKAKAEPAKAKAKAKAEPAKAKPAKAKPAKAEPAKAKPAKADPAKAGGGSGNAPKIAKGEEGSLDAISFCCEYAKSDRSSCKATKEKIEKGALRIGKVVENPWYAGKTMSLWYIPEALFESFRKGKSGKTYLTSTDDLEGYDDLKAADQKKVIEMIEEENEFREGLAAVDDEATYLEYAEFDKFWSIVVNEESTRVRYGVIGEAGDVSEKQHKDNATAEKFKEKMVKQKLKKGYVEATKAK